VGAIGTRSNSDGSIVSAGAATSLIVAVAAATAVTVVVSAAAVVSTPISNSNKTRTLYTKHTKSRSTDNNEDKHNINDPNYRQQQDYQRRQAMTLLLLQGCFPTMPVLLFSMLMVSVVGAIGTRSNSDGSIVSAGAATSLIVAVAAATAVTVVVSAAAVVSTPISNSNKTRTLSTTHTKAGQPEQKKQKSQPKLIGCAQDMSESKLS